MSVYFMVNSKLMFLFDMFIKFRFTEKQKFPTAMNSIKQTPNILWYIFQDTYLFFFLHINTGTRSGCFHSLFKFFAKLIKFSLPLLKASKSRKQFMVSSILPKCEKKQFDHSSKVEFFV